MLTTTHPNTTPTRRAALGFTAAAVVAGMTTPVLAAIPNRDATLIALCNQYVKVRSEECLLCEHDEYAPDFGPNHARYQHLRDEQDRIEDLIGDCQAPGSPAGSAAVARVALTVADRNSDGEITCAHFGEEVLTMLAESVADGFVWPPRPGTCSTAHWAPPVSPAEVAEGQAARMAYWAKVDAEGRAEREDAAAEQRRLDEPALLSDDELRGQAEAARQMTERALQIRTELENEVVRRMFA